MSDSAAKSDRCGAENQHLVCGREKGHDGPHVAFLPNVTVGWPSAPLKIERKA